MAHRGADRPVDILLVEDNPGDVRLTREGFEEARIRNDLHAVERGSEALDFLHQRGEYADAPRPNIVLLDMSLPGMDGIEVLERIRDSSEIEAIPVIVLTSSPAEENIVKSYEEHANAYLTKPVDAEEFLRLTRTIGEFWIEMVELPGDASGADAE